MNLLFLSNRILKDVLEHIEGNKTEEEAKAYQELFVVRLKQMIFIPKRIVYEASNETHDGVRRQALVNGVDSIQFELTNTVLNPQSDEVGDHDHEKNHEKGKLLVLNVD